MLEEGIEFLETVISEGKVVYERRVGKGNLFQK